MSSPKNWPHSFFHEVSSINNFRQEAIQQMLSKVARAYSTDSWHRKITKGQGRAINPATTRNSSESIFSGYYFLANKKTIYARLDKWVHYSQGRTKVCFDMCVCNGLCLEEKWMDQVEIENWRRLTARRFSRKLAARRRRICLVGSLQYCSIQWRHKDF